MNNLTLGWIITITFLVGAVVIRSIYLSKNDKANSDFSE